MYQTLSFRIIASFSAEFNDPHATHRQNADFTLLLYGLKIKFCPNNFHRFGTDRYLHFFQDRRRKITLFRSHTQEFDPWRKKERRKQSKRKAFSENMPKPPPLRFYSHWLYGPSSSRLLRYPPGPWSPLCWSETIFLSINSSMESNCPFFGTRSSPSANPNGTT